MKLVFNAFTYFCFSIIWWGKRVGNISQNITDGDDIQGFRRSILSFTCWSQDLKAVLDLADEAHYDILVALANVFFAVYALAGSVLIAGVLGGLSQYESVRARDRTIKFLLLKFVTMMAILPSGLVERRVDACLWTMWVTIVGYMHLIIGVIRDRLEVLATYPPVGCSKYVPPFILLFLVLIHNCVLGAQISEHAEEKFALWCLRMYDIVHTALLGMKTLIRYGLFILDMWVSTSHQNDVEPWGPQDSRSAVLYHTIFVFDMLIYALLLMLHGHIWYLHGLSLGLIDTVIFMDIRAVVIALHDRIKHYTNYCTVTYTLNNLFDEASSDQIAEAGDCAICRESMQSGKILPCQHIFHLSCLRSWFQQCGVNNYNCPLCRMALQLRRSSSPNVSEYLTPGSPPSSIMDTAEEATSIEDSPPLATTSHGLFDTPSQNSMVGGWPGALRGGPQMMEDSYTWSTSSLASSIRTFLTFTRTFTDATRPLGPQGAVASVSAEAGEEITSPAETHEDINSDAEEHNLLPSSSVLRHRGKQTSPRSSSSWYSE